MPKFLQIADSHLGLCRYGQTLDDQEAMLRRFAEVAEEHEVDGTIWSGDTFHHRKPGPHEILLFMRTVRRLTSGGRKLLISSGNHDGPGEVEDEYGKTTAWLGEANLPGLFAFARPGTAVIAGLEFQVYPYVHRRSVQAQWFEADIARAARDAVFVGHVSVRGAKVGAETFMQMGWDLTVPSDVFDGWAGAMLGHLHWQQQIAPRAWYAGSPERHDFGEASQEKGWLLWDIEAGREPIVTQIPSGARDMVTIEMAAPDDTVQFDAIPPGAVVRVRLQGPVQPIVARTVARALRDAGAGWVRVDVLPSEKRRERALLLDPAADVLDALQAWCAVSGEDYRRLEGPARSLLAE